MTQTNPDNTNPDNNFDLAPSIDPILKRDDAPRSALKTRFIQFILFIQDVYIALCTGLNNVITFLSVLFIGIKMNMDNSMTFGCVKLMSAVCDGKNVTSAVKYFYTYNSVHSCARMYMWLTKFGIEARTIEIITLPINGSARISIIDLDDEVEVLTQRELLFGTLNIYDLPSSPVLDKIKTQ